MRTIAFIASLSLALAFQPWTSDRDELWTDLDADGHRDVLLIDSDGAVRLFLGDAKGNLNEADSSWALDGLSGFQGVAAGDVDGDGATDLFLFGKPREHRLLRNLGSSFADVTLDSGLLEAGAIQDADWIDYDADGRIDLRVTPAGGGLAMFRNLGESHFTEVLSISSGAAQALGEVPAAALGDPETALTATAPDGARPKPPGAPGPAGSTGGAGQGGSAVQGTLSSGSSSFVAGPIAAPIGCARDIIDQAGGPCIEASTVPTPAMLLPLGPEFFVDTTGLAGFGTQVPMADVHVHGGVPASLRLSSDNPGGLGVSTLELTLDHDYDNGMELVAGDAGLEFNSRRPAQGGIPATFGPHLFISRFAGTKVGVAEPNPEATFHVGGSVMVDHDFSVRRPGDNDATIIMTPDYAGGGRSARVDLRQSDGNLGMILDGENSVNSGSKLTMYGNGGTLRVELDADDAGAAFLRLYKANNTVGITLDADQNGDARITTEVLEITGGADLVESFDTGDVHCTPGTVVVIDTDRPGELTVSSEPYDTRVAGIVSGAGGVQPGLKMGQTGVASGSTPVALTGRVYVRCNTENGAVEPGDLLTTSSVAGVAMKATDSERAFGAVIGKAMSGLESGDGLVLVLVNLQ